MIGSYRVLGITPPRRTELGAFVRSHHPARLKKLEQEHREFEWQQIQSLSWLGEDAAEFREAVRRWTKPTVYLRQYEQHGYPIFRFELAAITSRPLLGLPCDDLAAELLTYLDSRRRDNGSFNNTPSRDGGDGHVMNTWWGLQALQVLGRERENARSTVTWLRSCQSANGAFTYQPQASSGALDDVAYTWAAVRSLQLLGAAPADRPGCIRYLSSLWNADGGFSDRPGWASNPLACYYALQTLAALNALDTLAQTTPRALPRRPTLPSDLQVFSIQLEAHGQGSPAEAVELARSLRIHLWGAKNAQPPWLARAQAIADQRKVPVRFFVANEEYGTWVDVPGLGTYSHTSDVIAPSGSEFGAALANRGVVSWPEFRERRLEPLTRVKGRLIWQFGENEELVRLFLDDSLQRGGYAAISTYHFGNPDFTNSEPFLHRYRGHLPFVALQDAHGPEPWWFADMTTGFRTLFLAHQPTWEAWLEALEKKRVVAVRHDALSGFKTWMHAGSDDLIEFVQRKARAWQWWDNPEIQRPLVSVVAVRPADDYEVARPQVGVTLRVRCAWENTAQGLPRKPIAELVRLSVDGEQVTPTLVAERRGRGGALSDHYHQFHLAAGNRGKHRATAIVRLVDTGAEQRQTVEFEG